MCAECGTELEEGATECLNCGCPIEQMEVQNKDEQPQKVEVTGASEAQSSGNNDADTNTYNAMKLYLAVGILRQGYEYLSH